MLWDTDSHRRHGLPLTGNQGPSTGSRSVPDGRTLAAAGDEGKVVLWDAAHGYGKLPALDSGQFGVAGVAFSPDGKHARGRRQ